MAAGDYDNDGRVDLFLCQAGRNALFHNEGDGTFTEVAEKAGLTGKPKDLLSVCAAWIDYDGDGLLDLVVSQYTYWSPATDIRCSVPEAGEIYCTPRRYRSVRAHALPQPRRRPLRGRRASARGLPPRRTARAWASRSPT